MTEPFTHQIALQHEAATNRLAVDLAMAVSADDIVTLAGDLGAGKSTLARALIRALAANPQLEVPSPTFTLIQTYDLPRFPVVHADLYRVSDPSELEELGWDEAAEGSLLLVEWPERLGAALSIDRLEITLGHDKVHGPQARIATLTGHGVWAERLRRAVALRAFLDNAGWGEAHRTFLQGDASPRAYERLFDGRRRAVLMNAPRRPDGPVIRNGLPYSRIAHLAEDMVPFVAMAEALRDGGFSAPEIDSVDLDQGFMVLEDLGHEPVVEGDPPSPIIERYAAAVDVLATIHARPRPDRVQTPKGIYEIPVYDPGAMMIEVELLTDWYIQMKGIRLPASEKQVFLNLWKPLFEELQQGPKTWVLRDYHSPNLIWIADREGMERIGIIDFQDAMMGPAAYDVVSLLQDARITVPEEVELQLLGRYAAARKASDPGFSMATFARSYAIMGAQRNAKIVGIFARLKERDNKPGYLKHLPRVYGYLLRNLGHPALAEIRKWVDLRVPAP